MEETILINRIGSGMVYPKKVNVINGFIQIVKDISEVTETIKEATETIK